MLTVAALKEFGANTEEGLSRCMNNEAFYLRLVKMAAQESANYEALGKALESGDMKAGFEAAHLQSEAAADGFRQVSQSYSDDTASVMAEYAAAELVNRRGWPSLVRWATCTPSSPIVLRPRR